MNIIASIQSVLLLTAPASRTRIVLAYAAQHHHVLRGHEENDDQGEQSCLESSKLAERWLAPAGEAAMQTMRSASIIP